jgi:hypothetical protein
MRCEWEPQRPKISPPEDLRNQVKWAEKVKRFQMRGYVSGVINNTVADHLYRVAYFGRQINEALERMLWGHDLPEVVMALLANNNRDVTVVMKQRHPELKQMVTNQENHIAEWLFDPKDQELFRRFERGKEIVEFGGGGEDLGVVAAILDGTEGNMCFHYFVSRWCSKQIDSDKVNSWPEDALAYTIQYYDKKKLAVERASFYQGAYQLLAIDWLNKHLEFVQRCWRKVPENRRPRVITRYV